MTKKQLLKITGNKYRNVNKDELIIIAMNKFIIASIENYKLMPQDSKSFVKENKDVMKDEFFKLYNVKSKEFLDNITEGNTEESNFEGFNSEESKELYFNA
jgi:CRISPR/Cas system-associated endonuclease Cas1